MPKKTIDEKIDDLAVAMATGFTAVDKKMEKLPTKEYLTDYVDKKFSNLPDKAYLDDKLANLKGDLLEPSAQLL
ncbi:MAG: hypothetical protein Q7K39_00280 [Candidatus Magasanikbacteria bacterium]|nr:hypothetical protein [Candidatus Magasanikbacteria bacterium]